MRGECAGSGDGEELRLGRVGAAREDDGGLGSEDDGCGLVLREVDYRLREDVSGLDVRHVEDVRVAGDFGFDALVLRRVRRYGVVERERPVDDAAFDLSAAVHLREQRGVDGRRHVGVDHFDCGERGDLRAGDAEGVREFDYVLNDVHLDFDVGIHVEGGVGDEEYAVVALDLVDVDVPLTSWM